MSTNNQQVSNRRPPLSLSGGSGTTKSQQIASHTGGSNHASNTKSSQKTELTASERRDAAAASRDLKKQQQQQVADAKKSADEKKSQNGVSSKANSNGHGSGNSSSSSSNAKEKVQNGNNANNGNGSSNASLATGNKEVKEKTEKSVKQKDTTKEAEVKQVDLLDDKKLKKDVKIVLTKDRFEERKMKHTEEKESKQSQATTSNDNKANEANVKKGENTAAPTTVAVVNEIKQEEQPLAAPIVGNDVLQKNLVSSNTSKTEPQIQSSEQKPTRQKKPTSPIAKDTEKPNVSQSMSAGKSDAVSITPTKKTEAKPIENIIIDDVEMESLTVDASPIKTQSSATAVTMTVSNPAATSTPGKFFQIISKVDLRKSVQSNNSSPPERKDCPRSYSQISGRRSIRPISEYTPSKFQNNLQFRESYRRINTELDVTSTTNTSMNVTVGSEIPNTSSFSFSFFGRGRKRDRTPPIVSSSQSTAELHTDVDMSPPKRARLDKPGFFSGFMHSPMTLLRSAFTKASIQRSTSFQSRLEQTPPGDEVEVQNVSGIDIEEEVPTKLKDLDATQEITIANEAGLETPHKGNTPAKDVQPETESEAAEQENANKNEDLSGDDAAIVNEDTDADIKITEINEDDAKKYNRCNIM